MNRTILSKKSLATVLGLAAAAALAGPAAAQPLPPAPPVILPPIIPAPPAVFVATTAPVYYEGHASYWYRDRWVWREPHGWHAYEREPVFLHEHRMHAPPPRHYHYEHHRR
jgi:hypothetical protein